MESIDKAINGKYDLRSSRLTRVLGRLLCELRVSEDLLRGLREDKVEAIRLAPKTLPCFLGQLRTRHLK